MRRSALFGSALLVAAASCRAASDDANDDTDVDAAPPAEPDGAAPAESGDGDGGADVGPRTSPIKYIYVIEKENHTLDNMFGGFPGADTVSMGATSDGGAVPLVRAPDGDLPKDLPHDHGSALVAYADGGMNGFDRTMTGTSALLPYTRYTEDQIPNYWSYARNFVLFDQFHTTFMGPSGPGHFATIMAQARRTSNAENCPAGEDDNACELGCDAPAGTKVTVFDPVTGETRQEFPCFDMPTPFDTLPKGFTWRLYGAKPTNEIKSIAAMPDAASHYFKIDDAVTHADPQNQDLANLTFAFEFSEHPPHAPCKGENWTVRVVNRLMQGPHWNETAIVILYDDWGGFYDHVAPPVERYPNGAIFSLGFRVPALVISPYAKKGAVVHDVTEQASIAKLVSELWGTPLLSSRDPNARDGRAGSLTGAFDFSQPPRPPVLLQERTCP